MNYEENNYFHLGGGAYFLIIILFLIGFFLFFFPIMIISFIIKDRIDNKPIKNIGSYFEKSLFKLFSFILTYFLTGFGLMFLFFIFIIPGIIFSVYWSFFILAIILKDKKYLSALNYSRDVVKGRWWKVFGYFLFFGFAGFVIGLVFLSPFYFVLEFLNKTISPEATFVFAVILNLFETLVGVFLFLLSIIFFLNLDANQIEKSKANEE